jgi:hypothetical protein
VKKSLKQKKLFIPIRYNILDRKQTISSKVKIEIKKTWGACGAHVGLIIIILGNNIIKYPLDWMSHKL